MVASQNVTLLPLTDWIGDHPVRHGERGHEIDQVRPEACLCGEPDYTACPRWLDGEGIQGLVIEAPSTTG
jgi:hypothetical protein